MGTIRTPSADSIFNRRIVVGVHTGTQEPPLRKVDRSYRVVIGGASSAENMSTRLHPPFPNPD
jgi:hypothetical protein